MSENQDAELVGSSVSGSEPEPPAGAETWVVRDPSVLGEVIRAARDANGMTQADLAEAAGLHRSYLSNLERGISTDQTERLFRVLRRLGLEITIEVPAPADGSSAGIG